MDIINIITDLLNKIELRHITFVFSILGFLIALNVCRINAYNKCIEAEEKFNINIAKDADINYIKYFNTEIIKRKERYIYLKRLTFFQNILHFAIMLIHSLSYILQRTPLSYKYIIEDINANYVIKELKIKDRPNFPRYKKYTLELFISEIKHAFSL